MANNPAPAPLPTLEKCQGCGREVHPSWPAFYTKNGVVCMMCEGAEIDVYQVTHYGYWNSGYFDKEPPPANMFEAMDSGDEFVVRKKKMRLLQYLNLPEFGGF